MKSNISIVAILFCLSLVANTSTMVRAESGANAQGPNLDQDTVKRLDAADKMVQEQMASLNVPAYCLSVIKDGKLIFHKAYGIADIARRMPTTNTTVFGLASMTKTFTALTLLSLVDKGMIGLDDPLEKYIAGLTPAYRTLTIRQLASMTAGVPKELSQEVQWKDQLNILDHTPLVSQPGSAFLYSNFSYRLIGQVIENVTRRPYLEVITETVLRPLNMNSTATTTLLEPTGRVAQAYGDNGGKGPLRAIEYKDPRISFAAGMLATTSDDMVSYVFGLLSHKIISEKGYKTLWYERPPLTTGQPSQWAFGWSTGPNKNLGGKLTISMNGGTPGVASSVTLLPESNSAIITLCNLRKPPVYAMGKKVGRIIFGNNGDTDADENLPEGSD